MDKGNDANIPEMDMESRDWLKLENNMKTFGFQEGAAKGREATLQEGFNEGLPVGFRMGLQLGMARGILSYAIESGLERHLNFDEKQLSKFLNESCILCQNNKEVLEDKFHDESLKNIIHEQERHNDDILKGIRIPVSNLDLNLEKK